jgi:hypothetical protein
MDREQVPPCSRCDLFEIRDVSNILLSCKCKLIKYWKLTIPLHMVSNSCIVLSRFSLRPYRAETYWWACADWKEVYKSTYFRVYSRIKIKSSSQVNFLAYYGSWISCEFLFKYASYVMGQFIYACQNMSLYS